ncbi:MAG TPA: hypothetical protein VLF95_09840 [Vicinamibacteria bacterium]|nr:hypothetical protein [Vicinamibacteria bacterium]
MTFACRDLDDALREQDPLTLEAARAHATTCPTCRMTLALWDEIADAAPQLRREWPSPGLWPRIARTLAQEPRPRVARPGWLTRLPGRLSIAAAAALVLATAAWLSVRGPARPAGDGATSGGRFLTELALRDVERSEAEYVASIERLAALAGHRVEQGGSPLLARYREKLRLLDGAIATCRAELDHNRFNAHLRRELLSMYQEKRRTLEQIMEEET